MNDAIIAVIHCRNFLVLDSTSISIFTYSGRLHLTPKYPGFTAQLALLNEKSLSLGLHFAAVRDCGDESCKFRIFLIHVITKLINFQ